MILLEKKAGFQRITAKVINYYMMTTEKSEGESLRNYQNLQNTTKFACLNF